MTIPAEQLTQFSQSILAARPGRSQDRKVWGIGLATVWLPYFTATNAAGLTAIPSDALGAPIRLRRDKQTNEVRFGSNGRPSLQVVAPVRDQVMQAQANFVVHLLDYTDMVQKGQPSEYAAQVQYAHEAGAPIIATDQADLADAIAKMEQADAEEQAAAQEQAAAFKSNGRRKTPKLAVAQAA